MHVRVHPCGCVCPCVVKIKTWISVSPIKRKLPLVETTTPDLVFEYKLYSLPESTNSEDTHLTPQPSLDPVTVPVPTYFEYSQHYTLIPFLKSRGLSYYLFSLSLFFPKATSKILSSSTLQTITHYTEYVSFYYTVLFPLNVERSPRREGKRREKDT